MKTAAKLRDFRRQCEKDAGVLADAIEVPLLLVLADLCQVLGFSRAESEQVLGREGVANLDAVLTERATLRVSPSRAHDYQRSC